MLWFGLALVVALSITLGSIVLCFDGVGGLERITESFGFLKEALAEFWTETLWW